jgi:hypothetical protein
MRGHDGADLPDPTDFSRHLRKPVSLAQWCPIIALVSTIDHSATTNLGTDSLVSLRDNILATNRIKNTGAAQFHLAQLSKGGLQKFEEDKADLTDGVKDDGD